MRPIKSDAIFSQPLSADAQSFIPEDNLDIAGRTALDQIYNAARSAKETNKHARNAVHELTIQLQTARERIAELEAKVGEYQERAERAERWFTTIAAEIQRHFPEVLPARPEPTRSYSPEPTRSHIPEPTRSYPRMATPRQAAE
jgi:hypothetical protein